MERVKLSSKEKLNYYSPIIYSLGILIVLEFFSYIKGSKPIILGAPIIYLIFGLFDAIDFIIGRANLKFKRLDIKITDFQLKEIFKIMKTIINWRILKSGRQHYIVQSFNPKHLILPVNSQLIKNENSIYIASYLNPKSVATNTWTFGERKRNIKYFELAATLLLEGEPTAEIPELIKRIIAKEELTKSEMSLELMSKRILAYLIIIGLCFAPYLYKDSVLFYPFLLLPLIGIAYIVMDIKTIKSKSSR